MTVVGELVQAQIAHQDGRVAELELQPGQPHVENAVRVIGAGTDGVLANRHAEEHQAADAGLDRADRGLGQRVERVLHHPGHRVDRARLRGALGDEHRQDQISRTHRALAGQPTKRRGAA